MVNNADIEKIIQNTNNKTLTQDLLPLLELLNFIEDERNGYFSLPLSKENLIENLKRITQKHPRYIKTELDNFENEFHAYLDIKKGEYQYNTGITIRRHPPPKNDCDENSTLYYILKPELVNASRTALNNIEFDREGLFNEIFHKIRITEDLIYFEMLKRISEICINNDYCHYEEIIKSEMREILELAKIDNEIIELMFQGSNEHGYTRFEKIVPYLPTDQRCYSIFYSHDFNTSCCYKHHNLFIEELTSRFLYDRISKYPIVDLLSSSYKYVKNQMIENEKRLPLFDFKDYRFNFMDEYNNRIRYEKNLYTFELTEKDDLNAVEFLKEKNIVEIKDDKICLVSEDKFITLYQTLWQNEEERINRNKKELLLKWLRNGIDITLSNQDIKQTQIQDEEYTDNQKVAFGLISAFEKEFRESTIRVLEGKHGDKWWKNGVKENIKQKCNERLGFDKQKRNPITDVHNYLDFHDMYSLIEWKQNNELFKKYFPKDLNRLRVKLDELYDLRNPTMHSRRDISDDEILKIKMHIKDIQNWISNPQDIQEKEKTSLLKEDDNDIESKIIAEQSTKSTIEKTPILGELSVYLGNSIDNKSIQWEPDGSTEKSKMVSGNILITGGAGSGKTETLKSILYELNQRGFICLALAFHPDLVIDGFQNKKITAVSDFGINPLDFDSLDEEGGGLPIQIYNVVERLKVTYPTIGDIQEANLIEILEEAYQKKGVTEDKSTWKNPCPNFEDIEEILNEKIAEKGDKELLRLKNKLSKIFKFKIFSKSESLDIDDILNQSTIIDLSKLPEDFLFIVSDTILRKIYKNLKLREPITYDAKGKDRFRIFVAIDEAKILVPSSKDDSKAIINIFGTEARKFGVGFIVSSQLTEHFGNDILGNMATKIALKPLKFEIARDNARELVIDPKELMNIKKSGEGFIRFSNEETQKVIIKSYEYRRLK